MLLKHTWRVALDADAVPSITPEGAAAEDAARPQTCHLGRWVHLSPQGGAWIARGSPAVLSPAALGEKLQLASWPSAHTARAYCDALRALCEAHQMSSAAAEALLAAL